MCDINVRPGDLFEEGIIEKIVSHGIILVNNTVLQMIMGFYSMYIL